MRIVDTNEYINMLRDIINEGKEVSLLISGSSMSPFLCHQRDTVYLKKPSRNLRRGDIVFYQRDNGKYVLHRICGVHKAAGTYDMIGDGQLQIEYGIRREQIFAVVFKVLRKDRTIEPGDFWWFFFSEIWIRIIPLRRTAVRVYGICRKLSSLRF